VSFPNLILTPEGVLHSKNTGVPDNGINKFDAGVDLDKLDNLLAGGAAAVDTWLVVRVWGLGPSVTNANYIGRTGNEIRVNFTQLGTDQALVELEIVHSLVR